jgi:hypothetical protein
MAILDLYKNQKPTTAKINERGGDPEPIGDQDKYKPSKNLSKDQKALKRARGGEIGGKLYSETPRK